MNTIKAVVRNGRIETDEPLDLPEGTELVVSVPGRGSEDEEDGWDNSPEGIAAWLKWFESLEPLTITEKEQEEAEAWLKKCDEYDARKFDEEIGEMFR